MRHDKLISVLLVLYLMVIAALLIKEMKPVAVEDKAPVAKEDQAPVAKVEAPVAKDDKTVAPSPPADDSAKLGLTPNCEKELRRTADLLRFFANRIQGGEETQSVVADMRQQEKRISAVCD